VCPQVSCCGTGFWNIEYNTIININITKRTSTLEFADNYLLKIRRESFTEDVNSANIEMSNKNAWSNRKNVGFKDVRNKTMLISRMKGRKDKK